MAVRRLPSISPLNALRRGLPEASSKSGRGCNLISTNRAMTTGFEFTSDLPPDPDPSLRMTAESAVRIRQALAVALPRLRSIQGSNPFVRN